MLKTHQKAKTLIWLQSGGCGGCSLSFLCAESPHMMGALEAANIELLYHPSFSLSTGADILKLVDDIETGKIELDILCLEGSVMMGPGGTGGFHLMPGTGGRPMKDVIAALSKLANIVIAIGSCSAYGGITMSGGNEAEATGLSFEGDEKGGLLGGDFRAGSDLPVVNISGCPVHPDWVSETLLHISLGTFTKDDLDNFQRPKALSRSLVHHGCSRNEFYEFKASAEKLCEQGCMMENLGCKGTQAAGDCNKRAWNGSGSCISGGYPCIACTEPGFESPGHPFVETPKIAGIPIGLPTDMPKAWFVALASLSKAATPKRLKVNATSDRLKIAPEKKKDKTP